MKLLLRFSLLTALILIGRMNKKEQIVVSDKGGAQDAVVSQQLGKASLLTADNLKIQPATYRSNAKAEPAAQLN